MGIYINTLSFANNIIKATCSIDTKINDSNSKFIGALMLFTVDLKDRTLGLYESPVEQPLKVHVVRLA